MTNYWGYLMRNYRGYLRLTIMNVGLCSIQSQKGQGANGLGRCFRVFLLNELRCTKIKTLSGGFHKQENATFTSLSQTLRAKKFLIWFPLFKITLRIIRLQSVSTI